MGALADPGRADLVAALGETTGRPSVERMRQRMQAHPVGKLILHDQPRVTDATLLSAQRCPPGSLGAAYAHFMCSRRFKPNDRPPVRFVDDPQLAFVIARSREVHDFWHTLFSLPTSVTGELALKVIEAVQTGLPMCALAAIAGPMRIKHTRRAEVLTGIYPWAVGAGMRAEDLMCIYYEKRFQEDLQDLRVEWRIAAAPSRFFQGRPPAS